ncbi:DUF2158 domain-containing protein [Agrobacterium sp. BT-220-3]|nr:DUF2158 domain-containing protein [Agrobacterium sp. BT-220-3]
MAFKPGDVVQLKSGGPLMTVAFINEEGKVSCTWFNQDHASFEVKFAIFNPEMLKVKQ